MTSLNLTALNAALESEIQSTESLLVTLRSERQALGQIDPDQLQALTATKTEQVMALENLTQKRMQLAPAADQSMLIRSLNERTDGAAQQVLSRFATLLENGRQLARMNRVNGLTLRQGQTSVQQAITLLTGSSKQTDLYDAVGSQASAIKGQQLGTA